MVSSNIIKNIDLLKEGTFIINLKNYIYEFKYNMLITYLIASP